MICQDAPAETGTAPNPHINLSPADWFLATWRKLPALPLPEPATFDLERCLGKLCRARPSRYGGAHDLEDVDIPITMSRPEAQFWLRAILDSASNVRPKQLAHKLARHDFDGSFSPTSLAQEVRQAAGARPLPGKILLPLLRLFSPGRAIDLLLPPPGTTVPRSYSQAVRDRELVETFAARVLPYLADEDRQELRERLKPELVIDRWQNQWNSAPHPAFRLAAYLGLHAEMEAVVQHLGDSPNDPHRVHFDLVLGLGDPKLVDLHTRRLGCAVTTPRQLRGWLAHMELDGLEWALDVVRRQHRAAEPFVEVLCLVRTPRVARMLLEMKAEGLAPAVARRWLDANVDVALDGILPLTAGRGKLADAALSFVRRTHQRGLTRRIEDRLQQASEVASRVRRLVFEREENEGPAHDGATSPPWIATVFGGEVPKLPEWLVLECLPPRVIEARRLSASQVAVLLGSMFKPTSNPRPTPVIGVRNHVDPPQRDVFAWRLFELWRDDGSPIGDAWVLNVLGLLGGDGCALRLAPHIRDWSRLGAHTLAQRALEVLESIGTDTALLQLNHLSYTATQRRLREKARQMMLGLARDRNLTPDQLDDLAVPDLGLDSCGCREFSYGPRRFRAIVGEGLRLVVRDDAGKVRVDLPKPRKDEGEAAEAVRAEWMLFKKQLREAIRSQAVRLERSLTNARRWSGEEFLARVASHPLLRQLARQLLWGVFDEKNRLGQTFRLTEEGTLADVSDRECRLDPRQRVGLVHPAHMSEEQRTAWGGLFGDYEIVPPFPQLGRSVYRLGPDDEYAQELRQAVGTRVTDLMLLGRLSSVDWLHHWAGIRGRSRFFPGHDVTAMLELQGWGDKTLGPVRFFKGDVLANTYLRTTDALMLGEIDLSLVSEVAAEVSRLAAGGVVRA